VSATLHFETASFLDSVAALGVAFVFGAMIGLERQYRQRSAGLRTMVLVALGAAAFVHLGGRIYGGEGQTRIIAYVVSGIGFLGAGVIMKEGLQVRGLNTAATLWSTAAVGACAGAGLYAEAAAAKYIRPENLLVIAVGDKAKIESGLKDLKLGPVEEWSEGGPGK